MSDPEALKVDLLGRYAKVDNLASELDKALLFTVIALTVTFWAAFLLERHNDGFIVWMLGTETATFALLSVLRLLAVRQLYLYRKRFKELHDAE